VSKKRRAWNLNLCAAGNPARGQRPTGGSGGGAASAAGASQAGQLQQRRRPRLRPGTNAIRKIRKDQKTISKLTFARVVSAALSPGAVSWALCSDGEC